MQQFFEVSLKANGEPRTSSRRHCHKNINVTHGGCLVTRDRTEETRIFRTMSVCNLSDLLPSCKHIGASD